MPTTRFDVCWATNLTALFVLTFSFSMWESDMIVRIVTKSKANDFENRLAMTWFYISLVFSGTKQMCIHSRYNFFSKLDWFIFALLTKFGHFLFFIFIGNKFSHDWLMRFTLHPISYQSGIWVFSFNLKNNRMQNDKAHIRANKW